MDEPNRYSPLWQMTSVCDKQHCNLEMICLMVCISVTVNGCLSHVQHKHIISICCQEHHLLLFHPASVRPSLVVYTTARDSVIQYWRLTKGLLVIRTILCYSQHDTSRSPWLCYPVAAPGLPQSQTAFWHPSLWDCPYHSVLPSLWMMHALLAVWLGPDTSDCEAANRRRTSH